MTLVRVSDFFPILVSTLAFAILLIVSASNVSLFSHLPERGKYLLPASLSLLLLSTSHTLHILLTCDCVCVCVRGGGGMVEFLSLKTDIGECKGYNVFPIYS